MSRLDRFTRRNDTPTVSRLPARPGEVIDRSQPITFTWNGKPATGFAGDTIASAIAAAGNRIMSRSMKYHRPRGLLTADYWDPNAFVQVDDEPNVRSAHRLLESGITVSPQNVWPSLDIDVKRRTSWLADSSLLASTTRPSSIRRGCARVRKGTCTCTVRSRRNRRPRHTAWILRQTVCAPRRCRRWWWTRWPCGRYRSSRSWSVGDARRTRTSSRWTPPLRLHR